MSNEPCRKLGGKVVLVSNESCRKLAGKLLRFCGIRPIKNKKRTFPGERAPQNVLFYF